MSKRSSAKHHSLMISTARWRRKCWLSSEATTSASPLLCEISFPLLLGEILKVEVLRCSKYWTPLVQERSPRSRIPYLESISISSLSSIFNRVHSVKFNRLSGGAIKISLARGENVLFFLSYSRMEAYYFKPYAQMTWEEKHDINDPYSEMLVSLGCNYEMTVDCSFDGIVEWLHLYKIVNSTYKCSKLVPETGFSVYAVFMRKAAANKKFKPIFAGFWNQNRRTS